ncbi:MAG: phosphonopyruvate decarboxylase [Phycisphaerae bacterium]|nr:phosphonopyruvate decarboxylase [Gemmatimonadaceae bacterium]
MTARVSSSRFVDALSARNFGPYVGVPCSYLRPFIDYVIDRDDLSYIAATNEGEALAIAAGAQLAGRRPVVMLQNSGLGNLVNPLASLTYPFRIPVLLIVTLRGDAAFQDEPQHELMGRTTSALLQTLETSHELFPSADSEIEPAVERALAHMATTGLPYAFILRKDVVTEYTPRAANKDLSSHPTRREALLAIAEGMLDETVVVATTGKTGREWFEVADRERNLYLVGSMGCAPSVALGLAREVNAPLLVLDGDGAALMRLEALASVGHQAPKWFVHVVLDNEAYDSTGAQRTISAGINFPAIARACGYVTAETVWGLDALRHAVRRAQAADGPHFIHYRISLGASPTLARPSVAPHEVATRLRNVLRGS